MIREFFDVQTIEVNMRVCMAKFRGCYFRRCI